MTGFPNLPSTRGDTDDDASIHLFGQIKPARSIIRSKYDAQIMNILNTSRNNRGTASTEVINQQFENFVNEDYTSDNESEITQVEEEFLEKSNHIPKRKQKTSTLSNETSSRMLSLRTKNLVIIGFLFGAILITTMQFMQLSSKNTINYPVSESISHVDTRLQEVEESISVLKNMSQALDNQLDSMDSKQTDFFTSLKADYDIVQEQYRDFRENGYMGEGQYQTLHKEIEDLRTALDGLEILTDSPKDLESRLSKISNKLTQLSNASADIQEIKAEIVQDLIQKLPAHVPVYVQHNKIHYIPEFQNFLQAFVEKYGSKTAQDWKSFIREGDQDFQNYIQGLVDASHENSISKGDFERILNKRLAQISDELSKKYIKILEKVDLSKNVTKVDMADAGHKIVLDNLLEVIGKGSVRINYADYTLGSRVLGFLTTTGKDSSSQKSFARKVFLGWYDYLNSNGLRAPKNSKLNANNLLLDGGDYWQCEARRCTFGVRLSSPIILTDIILNNPTAERPDGLHLPTKISIYIKPKKRVQAKKLEEYVNIANFDSDMGSNKYLSKFYKVHEVELKGKSVVEHIQMPLSLVNMKIVIRDIFVKIEARKGITGVYNFKTYGLTEFNSLKYSQEFESILDQLSHNTANLQTDTWNSDYESYTMEDDDYF